jgi:flagellar hook protein FlgE
MALMGSLYAGWSGLRASSTQLGVVGDNIANVNTVGFKASRTVFSEALAQSMMGAGGLGSGVNVQAIQKMMEQGTLLQTGGPTDMALTGNGAFVVKGNSGGTEGTFYTRAGQFGVDKNGFLATMDGLKVQGFGADPTGAVGGVLGDLQVGDAQSPPQATGTVRFRGNLDSAAQVPPVAFDPTAAVKFDPSGTAASNATANYNFMQSTTVYDSLGNAVNVDVYFTRTAAGWDYTAVTDGGNLQGGTAGTPTSIGNGNMTFDATGKMDTHTQALAFSPGGGAVAPQALLFDFGDPVSTGGTGVEGITQYAGTSAMTFVSQDGFEAGTLANLQVDGEGRVLGVFTNGQSRALGQVAVAVFSAADQLDRVGSSLYQANQNSGAPNVGTAGSGGRGALVAGALEQSNVDLSGEFVQMIGAQRLFQANSKTIGTADQLLQELMQLKR